MQNELIEKREVLEAIKDLFRQEHETLKKHPINEQNIIGNKLTVIEIELKQLIKELTVIEILKGIIYIDDHDRKEKQQIEIRSDHKRVRKVTERIKIRNKVSY
jgi:RNA binding exosome subunit